MFYDFLTWIYFFAGRTYFLYLFLYSGLEFTLTFLTHLRFNFTSMDQGKMFLFIGILMACVQGGYVRKIPPGKEKTMVLRGLLLIVPSFAIVGFAQNIPTLYVGKYLLNRRLMGSTNQADPSCIYFRISWILMERPWFHFFPLQLLRGLRSTNIK